MRQIRRAFRAAAATVLRAIRAVRYCRKLGYSWHLAWVKAER